MSRRLSHDVMGVFGSRVGVALLGTVTGIILARTLGPENRGSLALVLLLPSTLMTITKLGITQANVYCVRREGAPINRVAANSLVLGVGMGVAGAVITWLLRNVLLTTVMRGVPTWALVLALLRFPLLLIDNFFCGVLQAMGNFSLYNRRTVWGAVLILFLTVLVHLVWGLTIINASVIYAVVTTLVVASLLLGTRSMTRFGVRPDVPLLGQQLRFGMKSYTQILTMHLLFRSDVYMVSYFLTLSQTAFYSLALHFTEMILEIPQAVGWVIYPRMAGLEKADVHLLTAQACRRTVLLTAAGGLAGIVLGPILIPLWYGQAFAAASRPLAFATLGMVMMSVFTILSRDFTSRNEQTVNIRASAVALATNLVLNIFMIPMFGISGAALATSIAYTLAAVMLLVRYRQEAGVSFSDVLIPRREDIQFIWNVLWQVVRRRLRGKPTAAVAPILAATATPSPNGKGRAARGLELVACTHADEWDHLVSQLPGTTVFHRMSWLRLIAERRGADLRALLIRKDGAAVGVFPVFVYRRGLFRVAASPPPQAATPYLGPVAPSELLPDVVDALTSQMRRERVSYLEMRFTEQIEATLLVRSGFQTEGRATMVLDLRPGPDQLWSGSLNSACRRAVRKATASGVTIEAGDLAAHGDEYYDMAKHVFAKSRRPPPLSREDYAALAELARQGGPLKVFFAYHQGRLIAGGIFPFDSHAVYYLDGVSDPTGQDVRPNNLLHWEVIRWAGSQGLVRYDMVGAGIESIARFKRSFGAVEVPYTYAFRSLDFMTSAARGTYALLAPAGRAMQHAVQRLGTRAQPKVPAEVVGND